MKWIWMALIFVRFLNTIYLWGVGTWKPNTIKCLIPRRSRHGPKETTSFKQRIRTFSNELIPQGMIPACCCIVMICQCLTQHTTLLNLKPLHWININNVTGRAFLPKKSVFRQCICFGRTVQYDRFYCLHGDWRDEIANKFNSFPSQITDLGQKVFIFWPKINQYKRYFRKQFNIMAKNGYRALTSL